MAAAKSIVQDITNETNTFLKMFTTKYVETLVLDKLQSSIEEALASALGENDDQSGDVEPQQSTSENEPKLPDAPGENNEELKSPKETVSEEKKGLDDATNTDTNTNTTTTAPVTGILVSGYTTMTGPDDAEYTSYILTGCKMSSFNTSDGTPNSKLTVKNLRYRKLASFNSSFQKQLKLEQIDTSALVFPGKKAFGKMNPAFVESRSAALKNYFEQVNNNPKLSQHPKFQEFFDLDEEEEEDGMVILLKAIVATCNALDWNVPPMVDLLKCDGGDEAMEYTLMYRFKQRPDLGRLGGVVKKTVQMGIAKVVAPQVLLVWKTVNGLKGTIQSKLDSVIQSKKAQIVSSLKSIVSKIINIPAIQKKLLPDSSTASQNTQQPGNVSQESLIDLDQIPSWQEFWEHFERKEKAWPKIMHEMNEKYWHEIFVDKRQEWEEIFKYDLSGQLSHYSAFKEMVSRHEHVCRATAHMLQRAYTLWLELLKSYDPNSAGNDQETEAYIRKMGLELAQHMDKLKNEVQGHCHDLSALSASTIVDEASLVCSYIGDLMVGMVDKQCVDKKQYAKQLLTKMTSDLLQGVQDATTLDACDIIQEELEKGLKSLQSGVLDFLPDMVTQYFPFLPFATRLLEHVILYRVKQVTSAQRQQSEQNLAQRLVGK